MLDIKLLLTYSRTKPTFKLEQARRKTPSSVSSKKSWRRCHRSVTGVPLTISVPMLPDCSFEKPERARGKLGFWKQKDIFSVKSDMNLTWHQTTF